MTAGALDVLASPALGNSSTEPPRTKAPAERPAIRRSNWTSTSAARRRFGRRLSSAAAKTKDSLVRNIPYTLEATTTFVGQFL